MKDKGRSCEVNYVGKRYSRRFPGACRSHDSAHALLEYSTGENKRDITLIPYVVKMFRNRLLASSYSLIETHCLLYKGPQAVPIPLNVSLLKEKEKKKR